MQAQTRLAKMVEEVLRAIWMALTDLRKSPPMTVMSLASAATSAPSDRAIPTSALAKAAASFTPSPIMATVLPASWRRFTSASLSWGRHSAMTLSGFTCSATCCALASESPVAIITEMPSDCMSATDWFASSRSSSAQMMRPLAWGS